MARDRSAAARKLRTVLKFDLLFWEWVVRVLVQLDFANYLISGEPGAERCEQSLKIISNIGSRFGVPCDSTWSALGLLACREELRIEHQLNCDSNLFVGDPVNVGQ